MWYTTMWYFSSVILCRVIHSFLHVFFETINKLKLSFECGIPVPQETGAPSLLLLQIFNPYIISIAVLENVPSTQGYRKEPPFAH
jgi:hypothetical protein